MDNNTVIILYASAEHLNSMLILAEFISKHHPEIHVTILSSAPTSAAASISTVPSISYRRIPTVDLPPNLTKDPVELFFEIPRLNNPNLLTALKEISTQSKIKAFVIDFFCNSALQVSTSLNIPTYFYVSGGGCALSVFLYFPTIDQDIGDKNLGELRDFVQVPGCPPIYSSDFPKGMFYRESNTYKHFLDTARNMRKSSGIVANSFDALEYRAKEAISNGLCVPRSPTPPVYFLGPLTARNGDAARHECLTWLDSRPSKSVVLLCFGRRGLFSAKQLKEIATGLERSGHGFIWSVRNPPGTDNGSLGDEPDLEALLPQGFVERTRDRGFIIKSWAPQREILSHGSIGGFVTHCGRSSVLEALSFGVPMIGFPMYAEQRMNRVFMVEEMKVALPLDEEGEDGVVVAASEVEKRVRELLGSSVIGRDLRQRVEELRISAEAAVRKNGSSVLALGRLVEDVTKN
uniref:Glycosyltransferase n=1 Tax=Torenia hybrid cultivar TaxID=75807 RepID=B7XH68_9LAMI|nr:UDP-sugar flavonoid 7-O-glycosyltransferase [Torenia hybrid cultivar]